MRPRTTGRYRVAIVALASLALAAGMAGVGIIAADASPRSAHAAPAAAPALIPCPIPIPIPDLCDTPSPTASASATASSSPTATASATNSASPTPTVSSTLTVTPSVTATRTTSRPTPTPTSTHGSTAHKPLAGFSHESATGSHPTRVVITLIARGSKITKLTHVKLQHCTWSLGKVGDKKFKGGKRKVKIIVNRSHESTKGSISFFAVNANHQHRVVKSAV